MPNSATGLVSALGFAEETVYGTAVAPSRWMEFLSESIELRPVTLQSNGLRAGALNLRRGSRRARTRRDAGGSLSIEVPTTGFGLVLKHLMGGTPVVAQQGGTTAWLQTHALGSAAGKSLTIQKQLRDSANALVQQFTTVGAKVLTGELKITADQILTCDLEVDGRDMNVSTAAGSASYPANNVFNFTQGTLTVGGATLAKVTDASVKLERPQSTDGFYLGSAGLKSEPVENDYPMVTGTLACEFDSDIKTAVYDRFAADTAAALVLTFTGAVISGAFSQQLVVTVPDMRFTGETPKVGGPDLVLLNAPWEAAWDGTSPGMTVTYQSTDVAV
ncbi:MAG: phage tail tube protein [Acidimicrobiales bacterium]